MLLRRASGELTADGGVPGNRSAGNSAEQAMKIRLEITKNGETVFEGFLTRPARKALEHPGRMSGTR